MIIYNHILTIGEKFRRGSKLTLCLLSLNQLALLFIAVLEILSIFPWHSGKSCELIEVSCSILMLMLIAISAAVSALRVYAVTAITTINNPKWSRCLVALTLVLGLVHFSTSSRTVRLRRPHPLFRTHNRLITGHGLSHSAFISVGPSVSFSAWPLMLYFDLSMMPRCHPS